MEPRYPSLEFEVVVGDNGMICLPPRVRQRFQPGSRVTIRVTDGTVSASLRKRNVTEEEIERIASLQLEQRENVIDFLDEEGKMAKNLSFKLRARKIQGKDS